MVTPTRVLIRLGRGWSAIGTATLEADTVTGMKLLHLRLSAMAQDVYVPIEGDPPFAQDLEPSDFRITPIAAGHA